MITPVLNTEYFVIRALERKDLAVFTQYRSQEVVAKYQSWTSYTHQEAVELFESMDYSTFGAQGNTASYRLLEKLGFRREAHLIQNVFFKGAWGDEY